MQISPAKKLAVWDITEPIEYFVDKLIIQPDVNRHPRRQQEQSVYMYLLDYLCGETLHPFLRNDENGKPYIENSSINVTFSHCKNRIACMVDKNGGPVGIDIETIRHNISEISKKFINENDCSNEKGLEHFQLIWGAKEVIYKIYSKKQLDFKQNMTICIEENVLLGKIHKNEIKNSYPLKYIFLNNFILVWNV